jgi:hypothetical protein
MDRRSDGRKGLIALALLVAAMIGVWIHKQFAAASEKAASEPVAVLFASPE